MFLKNKGAKLDSILIWKQDFQEGKFSVFLERFFPFFLGFELMNEEVGTGKMEVSMKIDENLKPNLNLMRTKFQEIISALKCKEKKFYSMQELANETAKRLDFVRELIEVKLNQISEKEKEFQLIQEKGFKELELKRQELVLILESVELWDEKINEKEKLIEGLFMKIELDKESIQKFVDEISRKERRLEDHSRELELIKGQISSREIEVRKKEEAVERREKSLALKIEEVEAKENQLELREKVLASKLEELVTKERERIMDLKKARKDNRLPGDSISESESLYPEPEFNDFDKDRDENCFAENQIWACYDAVDEMPRSYVQIKKVHYPKFKLSIAWLMADPEYHGKTNWIDKCLPVACGNFRLANCGDVMDHCIFSHKIHCKKGANEGTYVIYPRKGDIWALFRGWDLGRISSSEIIEQYRYEIVEILSEFRENAGIRAAYLDKMEGYMTLYQRTTRNTSFLIKPNEFFMFSHKIPCYRMNGTEREGVPKGSFELDPASLPTNLG